MFTAYVLTNETKEVLLKRFPPKFDRTVAHHITVQFGVTEDTILPDPASIKVVGYVEEKDGIEALVVSINDSVRRPDAKYYHITWSLDPDKYKPKDSNNIIRGDYTLILPITIEATPELVY